MSHCLIVIPARLRAARLPGKPLADIAGKPMIVHVVERALESRAGQVVVATDSPDIVQAVEHAGAQAVMTGKDHQSGSDRVHEAVQKIDPDGAMSTIINLQGDLPTLEPHLVSACLTPLAQDGVDIATLGTLITSEEERDNPNVVKLVATPTKHADIVRALYFTRAVAPYGEGPHYHHIGIYAYRRAALEKFVALPRSPLERREKLEQLRALEAGMRIDAALVDTLPLGVDTPGDLEAARAYFTAGK